MKKTRVLGIVALLFLVLTSVNVPAAHAVTVTRNTLFNSGLDEWNINPDISSSTWTPLVTHPTTGNAVNLHPESGFNGTVIYQNLKVTNIAGKQFSISARLTSNSAPPGKTVAIYLDYVTNANVMKKVQVLNPDNASVTSNTLVSANYTFPADARKLCKIEIAKETYGDFIIDNVVLSTTEAVTVSAVPIISSIAPASGPHGQKFVIAGSNFTGVKGKVVVAGSETGVTVNTWTNTQIEFTPQDPLHSGEVNVISDFVESNIDKTIDITSPGYAIGLLDNSVTVVKGEIAQYVVSAEFLKGFTTAGISFSIDGNASLASRATFTPVPLKNSGGVLLKIDTTTLSAGTYQASVKATESLTAPRTVPFTLAVVTVPQIKFFEYDVSFNKVYVTSKTFTTQGQVTIGVEAMDTGSLDRGGQMTVQSSNPSVLAIYKRMFGYEMYAVDSGSATVTATSPDGTVATLPVTVTLGSTKITSVSLTPSPTANTNTGTLNFAAAGSSALDWIGYDNSGMIGFSTPDFFTNLIRSADNTTAQSAFSIDTPSDLGTVLFYAQMGSLKRVAPLVLINGPLTGEVRGSVRMVDNTFAEVFVLELYSTASTKAFTQQLFLMHGDGSFAVGGIPPGTYRIRISSEPTAMEKIEPQWYPNAKTYGTAQPVTFTAGQAVGDIHFFARAKSATGPNIEVTPSELTFLNVPVGTTSASQKVTVYNRGSGSLTITALDTAGADKSRFSQTDNCTSVAVNGSCTANLTFSPNGAGTVTALLNIQSNDPDSPVVDLLLTGTGISNLPATPTAVSVKATGAAQIFIGWKDNATNETGFKLERKPGACADAGTWAEVGTVGANVATYTDTGLAANTPFSYKVRAYNASGHSSYTACASATTGLSGTPNSPTGFRATSAGAGTVNLAWTDNSTDETGFQIFRKTGAGVFTLLKTVAASPTSDATASGNTTTTAYAYYVKACNAAGCSPAASIASVPFAPTAFTAIAASATQVNLGWTDGSDNETGFQVERKDGNCASANAWVLKKTLAAGTTASNDTVVSGQTYAYRLRAYTQSSSRPYAYGYSSYAACQSVTAP